MVVVAVVVAVVSKYHNTANECCHPQVPYRRLGWETRREHCLLISSMSRSKISTYNMPIIKRKNNYINKPSSSSHYQSAIYTTVEFLVDPMIAAMRMVTTLAWCVMR